MSDLNFPLTLSGTDSYPQTLSERTRRIYDYVSGVYPASTFFFHSKAHRLALRMAGIEEGMRVLEVATGSGEMFRRLIQANRSGSTIGLDLSPRMAARTQRRAREEFPGAAANCQAVDARHLPFPNDTFDAVVCCYLLELLSTADIAVALSEFRRVLRPNRNFTLVLIGQNTDLFNRAYRVCGNIAPAFWGRQVDASLPDMIQAAHLTITGEKTLRQGFYPSRVLRARK